MAVPKGFRKNIKLYPETTGYERRQELLDNIAYKNTFLPKTISYEDIDSELIKFIKDELNFTINGEKVPVIFLTIQKWAQFSKTWQFLDEFKDLKLPFITIVRRPDVKKGTNQNDYWNIPGKRLYTYIKVPRWDGVKKGIDIYKIPQPVCIDITYEIRFFSTRMRELNNFNTEIQKIFASRQHYIFPQEHPMPLYLENISDESQISNIEERMFYVQLFELELKGYILDENEFEVIPAIDRVLLLTEIDEPKDKKYDLLIEKNQNGTFLFIIISKPYT